ncbi:GNAT family N-acetyltransferase [Mucilaginibacter sp. UR6-11]|uniref:GNAT family N-acetyltransferase n=1 Tax=Mucilaginibacter sp. UR6-11 TaxID=1435644 RepID=UPI001E55E32D|nr:GNAT family N-acetyltransferase [Mucilaginibacter sp. UR6-11]MCC8426847.1 GNAT family N-acetyltransferase [Mucilaginibacter sp. UR6-11]
MEHVLDNPAYNALATGNKSLARGSEQIKYFDKEVGAFIGFKENSACNFEFLHDDADYDNVAIFISPIEIEIPQQWQVLNEIKCLQMIYDGGAMAIDDTGLVALTEEHVPQMLELTRLTNPGPFASRTIDFGHYRGVFEGDKLIAMAGQRMFPLPYAEISAVCTHPDHTGKGYAKLLLQYHINRIIAEGNIPFLHVRCDNQRAIKVYESMGFINRRKMHFYVLKK